MKILKYMKWSKVIIAGVFAVALSACSNSSVLDGEGDNSKVTTFMTVNLLGSTGTRTTGDVTEGGIDTDENKVSSLDVALVSGTKVQTFTNVALKAPTTAGVQTELIAMKPGTYKVLVVVNPTAAITAKLASTSDYSSLQVALSEISTFATTDNFLMTNSINFKGDETNIPSVTITADNTEDNPAHAGTILVDRMAVKFRMNSAMTATTVPTYKINGSALVLNKYADGAWSTVSYSNIVMKGYALLNTYQKANLYQNWDGTSKTTAQQLITPNHSGYTFAAADYANGMDTYSTRTKANTEVGYSALKDLTYGKDLTALNAVSYCLENNPQQGDALSVAQNANVGYTKSKQETTGVLFRAQVLDDSNNAVTFYSYNEKLYADLASIKADHPAIFGTKTLDEVAALGAEGIRTTYGIKVYQDGYMYYTFYNWTTSYTDPTITTTNNHYYATIRNTIYDLKVLGMKHVGTDIPGGWDYKGNDPIDNNEMLIELSVNPWVLDFYSNIFE
jgi:hypothetical protein